MGDVTRILSAIEGGDAQAAEQLLPLVYDELRKLAAQKTAQESAGQTLQATALVHDAYLRLTRRRGHCAFQYQRAELREPFGVVELFAKALANSLDSRKCLVV